MRSLSAIWALSGALDRLSPSWENPHLRDSSMDSYTACNYILVQGSLLTLFLALLLTELIGLLEAHTELGLIDISSLLYP